MESTGLHYLCWFKSGLAVFALAVFWTWESWLPFFQPGSGRWRHAMRNVSLGYCGSLLAAACFGFLTALVANTSTDRDLGLLHAWSLSEWISWPVAILTLDAWMYVWHRLNHAVPWLWRFHRVHHSDLAMDVTSATRFHVGELLQSAVLRLALIPLFGWELQHLLVYDSLVVAVTYFHHANFSLGRWDRLLRLVIVTPFVHKVHHSIEPVETDSNYGTVLTIWDRLAGSLRLRSTWQGFRFGLREERHESAQTWWSLWCMPFRSLLAGTKSPETRRLALNRPRSPQEQAAQR